MLKTRIISSLALAAAVALGTSGCGFFVPQATTFDYAPSDGVDVDLPGIKIRNLLLVSDGDVANLVFTAVNDNAETQRIGIKFVDQGAQIAQANVNASEGLTVFGVESPEIVNLPGVKPGQTVDAFIEAAGVEVEAHVPVLDGTLLEYSELLP